MTDRVKPPQPPVPPPSLLICEGCGCPLDPPDFKHKKWHPGIGYDPKRLPDGPIPFSHKLLNLLRF